MVVCYDNSGVVVVVYEVDDDGNIVIDYFGVVMYMMLSVGYWGEIVYFCVYIYVDIIVDKIKNICIIVEGFVNEDLCECNNVIFDIS